MARRGEFDDDEGFFSVLTKRGRSGKGGGKAVVPMPPSMAKLLTGVAGLAVVATIAAISWATMSGDASRVDEETLPIMRADDSAYKIKPEEPGGMMVPNKDSTIFETLNEDGGKEKTVENLLEEPEAPMKKEDVFTAAEKEEESLVAAEPREPVWKSEDELTEEVTVKNDVPVTTEKIETAPAAIEPSAADLAPAPPAVAGGKSFVQFAAVKSDTDAKAKWKKLQSSYTFLGGMPLDVQKADLGAKGIFYRVRSGPMPLDQAQDLCSKVKAAKGDCLVIK